MTEMHLLLFGTMSGVFLSAFVSPFCLSKLRDTEIRVSALCLFYQSCSWGVYACQPADKQTSKDKWGPQVGGLRSYVLPFSAYI